MNGPNRLIVIGILLVLATACTQPAASPSGRPSDSASAPQPAVKKRVTAGVMGNLRTVSSLLAVSGTGTATPGTGEVGSLLNYGLTGVGRTVDREPLLSEAVPTTENGNWKLLPDGRMETTWRVRQGALWHDGKALTSEDVLFTAKVAADRELGTARDRRFDMVESVDAPDPRTVVVTWKQPFIQADALFETGAFSPMPAHLLSETYMSDKLGLVDLPYWNRAFVGTGPFKLREFVEGSHLLMDANEQFVLGKPRITEFEVKFVPANQTLIANVIADAVDMVLGRGLSLNEGATIRDQWRNGTVHSITDSPRSLVPQHTEPTPAIIGTVQFRRALFHAIDREEIAATLGRGLSPVAHVGIPLDDPAYKSVEPALVRYEYDTRRALSMIEELGYARGSDGQIRDGSAQLLRVPLRSSEREVNVNVILASAHYWNTIGVTAETEVVPLAESTADPGRYAHFPGFQTGGGNFAGIDRLDNLRPEQVPGPQNRYLGQNTGRYVNTELVGMIDRYFVTVPMAERMDVLRRIFQHITGQVVAMPLYYDATPSMIGARLQNVYPAYFGNAHTWDTK